MTPAGYFVWMPGLLGPEPQAISDDTRRVLLARKEGEGARPLCTPQPLTAEEFKLPINDLGARFLHLRPAQ